jgi:hypothetical protein
MTDHNGKVEKTTKEQLAQYGPELGRLKHALAIAFGASALSVVKPEDCVVIPLLFSCRNIFDEILLAVNEGHGRAALRSARTMYECAVTARYLHLHPEKTGPFLNMLHAQWAKIIQNFPEADRSPEMHKALAAKLPKYAAGKNIGMGDLRWTSDYTLKMAKEAGAIAELHSLAFDYASCFVHPSSMLVLSTLSLSEGSLAMGKQNQDMEALAALRIGHDLLINALDLRLKYEASEELRKSFEVCTEDFQDVWRYPPHI